MINLIQFKDWLDTREYGFPVTYLQFPENPDRSIGFMISEGAESKGTVSDLILDVYVRAEHPEPAIEVANKINTDLNMLTKLFLDNTQIILIKATNSVPVPYGVDDNQRHTFTVQFKMLASPTDKLNVKG